MGSRMPLVWQLRLIGNQDRRRRSMACDQSIDLDRLSLLAGPISSSHFPDSKPECLEPGESLQYILQEECIVAITSLQQCLEFAMADCLLSLSKVSKFESFGCYRGIVVDRSLSCH